MKNAPVPLSLGNLRERWDFRVHEAFSATTASPGEKPATIASAGFHAASFCCYNRCALPDQAALECFASRLDSLPGVAPD